MRPVTPTDLRSPEAKRRIIEALTELRDSEGWKTYVATLERRRDSLLGQVMAAPTPTDAFRLAAQLSEVNWCLSWVESQFSALVKQHTSQMKSGA